MKKRIAAILIALATLIPCAVFANADTVTVPQEPKLTSDKLVYYSFNGSNPYGATNDSNDGLSPETAKSSYGTATGTGAISLLVENGGTIAIPGKAYGGLNGFTFEKLGGAVRFTALDPKTNIDYTGTAEADNGSNGTQTGMWLWKDNSSVQFAGDYIFEDITILHRTASTMMNLVVNDGANLVIGKNVTITKMNLGSSYGPAPMANPSVQVDRGGVLFLHSVGFSDYTGEGTIVVDKALITENKISADDFKYFNGLVINESGEIVVDNTNKNDEQSSAPADSTTNKAPSSTDKQTSKQTEKVTEKQTSKITTADAAEGENSPNLTVIIIAAVGAAVAVAVVVIIIVKKKKS